MQLRRCHILPLASFAILVAIVGLFSIHTLTSIYQDIGRHITLGSIIWSTHHVPATNLFSYTAPDFPFINHHWLGEVLIYLGERMIGLQGLIVIKAIVTMAAFGLALGAVWRPRVAVPALVAGLVSAFILAERTDVRPEVLSFVFLAWYLFVLYRRPHSRLIWTLPLVQLLWVNTHIYFFMGPFLWLAFLVGHVFSASDVRSGLKSLFTLHFSLITLAIAVATLLNPHGLSGALYPLHILSNYGYSIAENKSPFFLAAMGFPRMTSYALYLGLALTAGSFVVNWRNLRRNVFGLVVAVAIAGMALVMIRNFPLFALAMVPIVLTNLDQAGWHGQNRQVLGWGMLGLCLLGVSIITNQVYDQAHMLSRRFGLIVPSGYQEPIDFFRTAGLKGPMFNNFDIGSFLIWKLPEEPVFIDGRPEAYLADFIQDVYVKMQEDPAVWQRYSEQYKLNVIFWNYYDITPWSATFVDRIARDPQWALVYRENGIMILVKNVPANAGVIAKYRLR